MRKEDRKRRKASGSHPLLMAGAAVVSITLVMSLAAWADASSTSNGDTPTVTQSLSASDSSSVPGGTGDKGAGINGSSSDGSVVDHAYGTVGTPASGVDGVHAPAGGNHSSASSNGGAGQGAQTGAKNKDDSHSSDTGKNSGDDGKIGVQSDDDDVDPTKDDIGNPRKPKLEAVLADNNRFDYRDGALRMDVVIRVKHGDVDPDCVPSGYVADLDYGKSHPYLQTAPRQKAAHCLQLYYGWNDATTVRPLYYVNTLGKSGTDNGVSEKWVKPDSNFPDFYTIRGVSNDGAFDYLTVSIRGGRVLASLLKPKEDFKLGGNEIKRHLYAVVDHYDNYTVSPDYVENDDSGVPVMAREDLYDLLGEDRHGNEGYITDITQNSPVYSYDSDGPSGPVNGVGLRQDLGLWRGSQPNWGLDVANGFDTVDGKPPVGENNAVDKGLAPAKAFYAYWLNGARSCGETNAFYYEWFGLKNGSWVPVTSITSHALTSFNQGKVTIQVPKPNVAYNASAGDQHYLMGDGPNQKHNGSINFDAAKKDQSLDGYFKLVTWPITTNGGTTKDCVATGESNATWPRDIYNPLTNNEQGVTAEMAQKHPDQAQSLMNMGTTVATVFDGYDYQKLADVTPARPPEPRLAAANDIEAHTPKLVKMLGYNKRHKYAAEEVRADFVLRVAHGDVHPDCVHLASTWSGNPAGTCGLYLGGKFDPTSSSVFQLGYINTWRDSDASLDTDAAHAKAAGNWARQQDNNYTVYDVQHSGIYDFLTISVEYDNYAPYSEAVQSIAGNPYPMPLYAKVGSQQNWTNIAVQKDGKPYQAFNYVTGGNGCTTNSAPTSADCQGPYSLPGWDQSPLLWSNGQSNWGLITDKGLVSPITGASVAGKGIAPKNSFFTSWFNQSYNARGYDKVCNKVNELYFQWIGLSKNGDWVPVTSLTKTAQKVQQTPSAMQWTPGTVLMNTGGQLIGSGAAQNGDGSINFGRAIHDQPELSGYFMLVTWPISKTKNDDMSSCSTGSVGDVYNPLTSQNAPEGITKDMSAEKVDKLLDLGWTIDTAYNQFKFDPHMLNSSGVSIDGVEVPHTVKPNGELSTGSKVTVKGTMVQEDSPKSDLTLYAVRKQDGSASDPNKVIADDGNKVGTVSINGTGKQDWSIDISPNKFLNKDDVREGDVYRFIAVDTQDGMDTSPVVKDSTIDMTPPVITNMKMGANRISGELDPADSHKDMSASTVTVVWTRKDNDKIVSKTATVNKDGSWSIDSPLLPKGATVRVDVVDESHNEGKTVKGSVSSNASTSIPLTGSRLMWIVLAVAVMVLADAAYRYARRRRTETVNVARCGTGASHVRPNGPRHVRRRSRSIHDVFNERRR
ncbi:hypothetical protein GA0061078_1558 [Bifidobacterium bohemicum]|uniref:Putative fimbrial subunit FimB n=1 Tax=Bifidobacterium bohemicum DSM 22767 TaxID=1437606 RepID=A0A086ZEQ2_9BIFI|nr:hypothetical protein [Bifidobacterium bohemicum]KFI45002.1 putative fimbrial subunit FimB [Bifidobacterium bohemicum DSM 22767]SCC13038.1 hypothetical protein GA0061078_1558 [Bifidobacterium bohemicum]